MVPQVDLGRGCSTDLGLATLRVGVVAAASMLGVCHAAEATVSALRHMSGTVFMWQSVLLVLRGNAACVMTTLQLLVMVELEVFEGPAVVAVWQLMTVASCRCCCCCLWTRQGHCSCQGLTVQHHPICGHAQGCLHTAVQVHRQACH